MDRNAAVAGEFYPANPETLRKEVTGFIDKASYNINDDSKTKNLKGVIVPHAGYVYSGPVAGFAYRRIREMDAANPGRKTVFILGPAHFAYTTASIGMFDSFVTPLGKIKVNRTICQTLQKDETFDRSTEAHLPEHSIEVQLPFLQECLADFEIVPILLGEINPAVLADKLQPYFGKDHNLFVFSSDLSHYLPYEEAVKKDRKSLEIITGMKIEEEPSIDACGHTGIKTAMRLARNTGVKIKLLDYRNSGDTAGDKRAVVGYASLSIS
jgi:MEMO1 family protein